MKALFSIPIAGTTIGIMANQEYSPIFILWLSVFAILKNSYIYIYHMP